MRFPYSLSPVMLKYLMVRMLMLKMLGIIGRRVENVYVFLKDMLIFFSMLLDGLIIVFHLIILNITSILKH